MNKKLKKALQLIGFLLLGITLLTIVYRTYNKNYQEQCIQDGIPLEECNLMVKLWSDIEGANFFFIGLVILSFVISNISRAYRWQMLLKPLGHKARVSTLFLSVIIAYFANLGFPRIGEVVRAGTVAKYEKIDFSKVMGTVIVDRILDLIVFAMIIVGGGLFAYDNIMNFVNSQTEGKVSFNATYTLGVLAVLGVLGILALRWVYFTKSENAIIKKVQNLLKGFVEGMKTIKDIDNIGLLIFHTVVIWLMFYLMMFFGFKTFEQTADLGFEASLTVFIFGSLGFVIPSPGGMGTYHFLVTEGLRIYGVDPADGFSLANIMYFTVQVGINILLGIAGLLILPIMGEKDSKIA